MNELVFLINTFNKEYYVTKAFNLYESIKREIGDTLPYHCIIVQGGSKKNLCSLIDNECHFVQITENLSDHNVYIGFDKFLRDAYTEATFVLLHDTCVISSMFSKCMKKLSRIQFVNNTPWIFAHTFGLYNMGICRHAFVLQRASEFHTITVLPKKRKYTNRTRTYRSCSG